MSKTIIVYGSTTGNCETMAFTIKSVLADAEIKSVSDCNTAELANYDTIILGSSTWGDGELQDDFIDFDEALGNIDLSGKKAAIFGCGDSYGWSDTFCEAVTILENTLRKTGAEIIVDSFKADGDIAESEDDLKEWSNKLNSENLEQ